MRYEVVPIVSCLIIHMALAWTRSRRSALIFGCVMLAGIVAIVATNATSSMLFNDPKNYSFRYITGFLLGGFLLWWLMAKEKPQVALPMHRPDRLFIGGIIIANFCVVGYSVGVIGFEPYDNSALLDLPWSTIVAVGWMVIGGPFLEESIRSYIASPRQDDSTLHSGLIAIGFVISECIGHLPAMVSSGGIASALLISHFVLRTAMVWYGIKWAFPMNLAFHITQNAMAAYAMIAWYHPLTPVFL